MGKLNKFYTKQEKTVEKVLPLSKDKMVWNRPGEAEIVEISKYGEKRKNSQNQCKAIR